MRDPAYLNICCRSLAEALAIVAALRSLNVSAGDIQVLAPEALDAIIKRFTGYRPNRLVASGAVICSAVVGLALVVFTLFLFPFNALLLVVLFALGYCMFEPSLRSQTQKHMRSIGNGEIQILVRVTSQIESDRLCVTCENILELPKQQQAGHVGGCRV